MKRIPIRELARNPALRIGAGAVTLIAAGLVGLLLIISRLEGDSDGQSGSQPSTFATVSVPPSPAQITSALPPAYLQHLMDLLNSLPQPDSLTPDVPPTSGVADVYRFYRANSAPEQLLDFYRRELVELGWQPEDPICFGGSSDRVEQNQAAYSKFVKDDLAIIVGAAPTSSMSAAARLVIDIAPRGGANPPPELLDVFNALPAPSGLTVDEPPRTTGIDLQAFFWAEDKPEQVVAFYNRELVALGWQPEVLSSAEHGLVSSKFVNQDLRITIGASSNEKSPSHGAANLRIDIRPRSEP